jgi:ribosomal protein S27AE
MLTVKCPRCSHDMLYRPLTTLTGKKKRCVYCGMLFAVHTDMARSRIVCEGKRAVPNAPLF